MPKENAPLIQSSSGMLRIALARCWKVLLDRRGSPGADALPAGAMSLMLKNRGHFGPLRESAGTSRRVSLRSRHKVAYP